MNSQLTRCPQVNNLLASLEGYVAGVDDELWAAELEQTDAFFERIIQTFEAQLAMSPPTPVLEVETPLLRAALEAIQAELGILREAMEGGQMDPLTQGTELLKNATADLFGCFDRLQAEEAKEPVLSRSPFLNQLMKVGAAVTEGKMDGEVFRALLTEVLSHHQQSMAFVRAPEGADPARKAGLESAVQRHLEGLQEAELYFKDGDAAHIAEGLGKSNQAAEDLYALDEAFVASAEATRVRSCMRCGADNDISARHCEKCGAVMKQMQPAQESTFDVSVEEGVRATGHVMTETTQHLVNMVGSVHSGQHTLEDLAETLNSLEKRMQMTATQLESVDPEKQGATPEDVEAMKWAQQMMTTGLSEMAEGIIVMRRALDGVHTSNLDVGMEAFLTGADKMAAVTRAAITMEQTGVVPG